MYVTFVYPSATFKFPGQRGPSKPQKSLHSTCGFSLCKAPPPTICCILYSLCHAPAPRCPLSSSLCRAGRGDHQWSWVWWPCEGSAIGPPKLLHILSLGLLDSVNGAYSPRQGIPAGADPKSRQNKKCERSKFLLLEAAPPTRSYKEVFEIKSAG